MIVVVMGLSGSGKSFIAKILHEEFGFEWIRSDAIRKELAGVEEGRHVKVGFGKGIYSEDWTKRVYQEMIKRAEQIHSRGKDVVLDATFLKDWQRNMVKEHFKNAIFLLTQAQEEEIKRRLSKREDISDADFSVYLKQKEIFEEPKEAIVINTQKGREEIKAELQKILGISYP
ncbi:AAA family ATPase [Hydrogenobacter thermophilus]|uniref:AAA family ATPase n=1 Tax=Hydrogenobacter thermophilus TaxID=940 RepID=UPI0030F61771